MFIITSLLVPWRRGGSCRWGFPHHLGLWFMNGQSWKRGQSNSRNVFALSARVLGPRAFSLPARIDEGGRELREETIRNQATITLAEGTEQILQVGPLPSPSLNLNVAWLLCGPAGDSCKGRWGRWAGFPLGALPEKQATQEEWKQSPWGHLLHLCGFGLGSSQIPYPFEFHSSRSAEPSRTHTLVMDLGSIFYYFLFQREPAEVLG